MRNRFLTILIPFLFAGAALHCQEDVFSLRQVLANTQIVNDNALVQVSTKGKAPSSVTDGNNWSVQMTESGGNPRSITVHPDPVAEYTIATKSVTLKVPVSSLVGLSVNGASWSVVFSDGKYLLNASPTEKKDSTLREAKGRDDADLYGSFSFLTGVGTSPIWMIDVKAGYAERLQRILHPHSPTRPGRLESIRTGIFADVQTNTDTAPPVDRTEIDPDSIRAFWKFFEIRRIGHRFFSMYWEVQPAGGEFNRSNSSSNFVGEGKLKFVTLPFDLPMDFIPSLGLEIGENLNKPRTLFDRPVDLSNYDAIRRLVPGAVSDFYIFRKKITDPDDPYLITITGSWVARIPFSPEPFTVSQLLPDTASGQPKRQKVVTLRGNTRHNVHVDLNWNITKLLGFQLGYKYGSLPPLFELVNHQVTIGLVFKAKFNKNHSVSD